MKTNEIYIDGSNLCANVIYCPRWQSCFFDYFPQYNNGIERGGESQGEPYLLPHMMGFPSESYAYGRLTRLSHWVLKQSIMQGKNAITASPFLRQWGSNLKTKHPIPPFPCSPIHLPRFVLHIWWIRIRRYSIKLAQPPCTNDFASLQNINYWFSHPPHAFLELVRGSIASKCIHRNEPGRLVITKAPPRDVESELHY